MKKSIEISPNIETLFGTRDENLHVLEDGLNIAIDLKSDSIELEGAPRDVGRAEQVFTDYDQLQRSGFTFNNGDLNSMLRVLMADPKARLADVQCSRRASTSDGISKPLKSTIWCLASGRLARAKHILPLPWPSPPCWPSA